MPHNCLGNRLIRRIVTISFLFAVSWIWTGGAVAIEVSQGREKRSCIQAVDGFAYLSENMTLSETRSAAFANAKRQALEMAKTYIRSKTKVTNHVVDYDTVWADADGAVTVLEQKDIGVENNNRYHVWIKAEVEYALKPVSRETSAPAVNPASDPNAPLTVKVWTPRKTYRQGEQIEIFLQGNRDFYARIVDITAGGDIIQLLPNAFRKGNFFKANTRYKIPDSEDRFDLTVSPPFGEDKIIAYVSEVPLGIVSMTPAEKGLSVYRGSEENLGVQTRGISIVSKSPARQATGGSTTQAPAGAEFFEAAWIVRTSK